MKRIILCLVVATMGLMVAQNDAMAGRRKIAHAWGERFARTMPWHGDYYYTPWGSPTALVVPPTSNMQVSMGWGVTQTTMTPIYHQFNRPYPGGSGGMYGQFRPTPRWPSHTDQFGIYYVRGPW